jgi:putative GTP pyrophosphokinase
VTSLRAQYARRHREVLTRMAPALERLVRDAVADLPRVDRIAVRAKDVDRFVKKAKLKIGKRPKYVDPLNQIQDQLGARIVVFYLDDVKRVARLVDKYFRPVVGGHPIPRRIGEDRGGVIRAVHHSPVKIWAGGLGAA